MRATWFHARCKGIYHQTEGRNTTMKYFGTVTITLSGWFEADGIAEIKDDPMRYATNCIIETENFDIEEEESDGDWEE